MTASMSYVVRIPTLPILLPRRGRYTGKLEFSLILQVHVWLWAIVLKIKGSAMRGLLPTYWLDTGYG